MTDDAELLASAYLDNEATADERARVQADSELLAEVERFRGVRAELADIEPTSISVREDQLATALAAWDRLPATERLGTRDGTGGATITAASATTRTRRPRLQQRWLLGAAAALVVVVGAGIVLQQFDPSSGDDEAEEAVADTASDGVAEEEFAEAQSATESELGESSAADELTGRDLQQESDAIEAIDEEGGSTDELTHSAGVPDQGPPSDSTTSEFPQLLDANELIAFAAPALEATAAPASSVVVEELLDDAPAEVAADAEVEPAPTTPECPDYGIDVLVGPAVYVDVPVMVGVDVDAGRVIAYHLTECTLVESLPIPN